MTKEEALNKIEELKKYIENLDKPVGYKNDNIFLLSAEEYNMYEKNIPHIHIWWWLRSPGCSSRSAAGVYSGGSVDGRGSTVYGESGAVRPAINYSSLNISSSRDKDYFLWNENKWKIIDKNKKIAISTMPIAFDRFDEMSDVYEDSYIRKWLLNWYNEGVEYEHE